MELKRCSKGHYYDLTRYSSCPHCGAPNLEMDYKFANVKGNEPPADILKTQAKHAEEETSARQKVGAQDAGKTIGMMKKSIGMDPVVGWLVCIEGPERGKDYRIHSERNFIGRSEKMDIVIAGDEAISRENHAIISYSPKTNSFRIYSGDSRGLVYLNNEEVISPIELKPYDTIELGQTRLMFVPFCSGSFIWN